MTSGITQYVPPGTISGSVVAFADVSSTSVEVANLATTSAFTFTTPASPGLRAGLTATLYTDDGEGARFVHDLASNAIDLVLDVPAAPHLVSPALVSGEIAPGTTVEWTGDAPHHCGGGCDIRLEPAHRHGANQRRDVGRGWCVRLSVERVDVHVERVRSTLVPLLIA